LAGGGVVAGQGVGQGLVESGGVDSSAVAPSVGGRLPGDPISGLLNLVVVDSRRADASTATPDHQPQRQQELTNERDEGDIRPGTSGEHDAKAIDHIAETGNSKQDAEEPGDIQIFAVVGYS
jgi:hypothetical protein